MYYCHLMFELTILPLDESPYEIESIVFIIYIIFFMEEFC